MHVSTICVFAVCAQQHLVKKNGAETCWGE